MPIQQPWKNQAQKLPNIVQINWQSTTLSLPSSKNYLWKFPSVLLPIIPDETLLKTRLRKGSLIFLLLLGHTACSGVAAGLLSLYPRWELSQNVVCFL